jgi:hypothetical protein
MPLIIHTSASSGELSPDIDSNDESDPATEDTSAHDDMASSDSGSVERCPALQKLARKEDRSEDAGDEGRAKSLNTGVDMLRL